MFALYSLITHLFIESKSKYQLTFLNLNNGKDVQPSDTQKAAQDKKNNSETPIQTLHYT